MFSLEGDVAVVVGGSGTLGSQLAAGLSTAGARVAVLGRNRERAQRVADSIASSGGEAIALVADTLVEEQLCEARAQVEERFGPASILVNCAGGNRPSATTDDQSSFWRLPLDGFTEVMAANFTGTVLACQVFGESMVERASGAIVNISSVSAERPLTRVPAYSAAKSAVESLTRWLAVDLGQASAGRVRVNAIAPGFFLAEQNRALLLKADGTPTSRGGAVLANTPAGRFGEPHELVGALVWLCSQEASFVTGAVVTVDGGFSAFAGV